MLDALQKLSDQDLPCRRGLLKSTLVSIQAHPGHGAKNRAAASIKHAEFLIGKNVVNGMLACLPESRY